MSAPDESPRNGGVDGCELCDTIAELWRGNS